MNCEICGAFEENLLKTEVEGAVMNLCKSCSKYGKVIGESDPGYKSFSMHGESEKQLKENYIQAIKDAAEQKRLSINELADRIKCSPKDLEKIVKGQIMPNNEISVKLERFLGISLYEMDYVSDANFKTHVEKLSFGDIVDIKRTKK